MNDFVIFTDSGCDIPSQILDEWGVKACSLTFKFDDDDTVYSNGEMSADSFYKRMREGGVAKTSAINPDTFLCAFEEELAKVGEKAIKVDGYNDARWIVLDYGDVLVHVFYEEDRLFYNLERLWQDAKEVDISDIITED